MGLAVLVLGLAIFLGAHLFVSRRKARAALIAHIGERPYKALFALVALTGLAAIVEGFGLYRTSGYIDVWTPPSWMRHVTVALVWPAAILVTAAYIPGDIKRTLKHPLLAGVKLWAFAHLLSNGDLGGIILFGGRRNDVIAIVVGTILYLALGFLFHPLFIGIPVFGSASLGV